MVAALLLMLLGAAGLVLMYNTSQTTGEKMKVVNAADAAAYSGAVWTARPHLFKESVTDPKLKVMESSSLGTDLITAVARAEIKHERPDWDLFSKDEGEYSNLYNPFWKVKLTQGVWERLTSSIKGL